MSLNSDLDLPEPNPADQKRTSPRVGRTNTVEMDNVSEPVDDAVATSTSTTTTTTVKRKKKTSLRGSDPTVTLLGEQPQKASKASMKAKKRESTHAHRKSAAVDDDDDEGLSFDMNAGRAKLAKPLVKKLDDEDGWEAHTLAMAAANALEGAQLHCLRPTGLLGVQAESPVAFSPDSKFFAFVCSNGSLFVISIDKERKFPIRHVLSGHTMRVSTLMFRPGSSQLISGGVEGFFVWDTEAGVLQHTAMVAPMKSESHESDVLCLEFLYDGTTLVSGSKDNDCKAWDMLSGKPLYMETLTSHKAPVLAMCFCRDTNVLATAGRDSSIKLWDVATLDPSFREKRADDGSIKCQVSASLDGHRGDVVSLEFASDGARLFSGARDNEIKVWDVSAGVELRQIKGHRGDVRKMLLLNKEKDLAADAVPESTEAIFNAEAMLIKEDGTEKDEVDTVLAQHKAHDYDIAFCALARRVKLMATSTSPNCVRLWDVSDLLDPKLVHEFVGHTGSVTDVVATGDDHSFLSCSIDYGVSVYTVEDGQRTANYNFGGSVRRLAMSPDGNMVYAGGKDYTIKGYSLGGPGSRESARFVGHAGAVEAIAIHPSGKLMASGGHDFNIILWPIKFEVAADKVANVHPQSRVDAHRGHVTCLDFSEDGSMLVSGATDHSIIVWKVKTGLFKGLSQKWMSEEVHASVVTCVLFGRGPSAGLVLSGSWDSKICVWDAAQGGEPLKMLAGHQHKIADIALTRDGKQMISASADSTLRLWNLNDPYDCVCSYIMPPSEGAFTAVSCSVKQFVSASESGVVRVWPLPGPPEYKDRFLSAKK